MGLTSDTYRHFEPEVQRAAAERMEALLRQLDEAAGGAEADAVDRVAEARSDEELAWAEPGPMRCRIECRRPTAATTRPPMRAVIRRIDGRIGRWAWLAATSRAPDHVSGGRTESGLR